jgi:gp16 family phage-associated protein
MKTPDQVNKEFIDAGITISQWARDHGYTPRQVSLVLNGQIKGRYGKSHEIAKKLGLKTLNANSAQAA